MRPINPPPRTLLGVPTRHPFRGSVASARGALRLIDLHGADLRGMDLRGLDFSRANLIDADLSSTRCGMSSRWAAFVALASLAVSVGIGIACGIAGHAMQAQLRGGSTPGRVAAVFLCAELLVLLVGAVWKGPRAAAQWIVPQVLALAIAGAVVARLSGYSGLGALVIFVGSLIMLGLLAVGAMARAVAGSAGRFLFLVVAISGALAGRALGGGLVALAMAVGAALIGKRMLTRPELAPILSRCVAAIVRAGGTSFRGADLRGAHLEQTRLECCDLRDAKLDGAFLDHTTSRALHWQVDDR
jgi:hypothetical protein